METVADLQCMRLEKEAQQFESRMQEYDRQIAENEKQLEALGLEKTAASDAPVDQSCQQALDLLNEINAEVNKMLVIGCRR